MKKLLVTAIFCVLTSGSVAAETQWWEKCDLAAFKAYCDSFDVQLYSQVMDSSNPFVKFDTVLNAAGDTIEMERRPLKSTYSVWLSTTSDSSLLIQVRIYYSGGFEFLEALGLVVQPYNRANLFWGHVPLQILPDIASHSSVDSIKARSWSTRLNLDNSSPAIGVPEVHQSLGYTGEGVLIGILVGGRPPGLPH